jgi:hypothetical protein
LYPLQKRILKMPTALLTTILVALTFIIGCQKNDPDSFTVNVEALAKPNQYQTHLKWNVNDDDGDNWTIQRQVDQQAIANVATVSHDAHDYVDTTVVAGTTYHYGLTSNDSGASTVKKTLDITVPRDLAISGVTALPSVTGIGRFIISKGSKITTNGKDIDISVDQIISDGGVIETFPEGQTAQAGTSGRPGGKVAIHAKTGSGVLYVTARGEAGGASNVVGTPGGPGSPGYPGANAVCGFRDNDAACGAEISQFNEWKNKCAQGGIFNDIFCKVLERFYCKAQPGNGGQGTSGLMGGPGGVGFSGGDSGNVLVEISDPTNIQINPTSIAGAGGVGGPGGPGGVGGNGGAPGVRDHLNICTGFGIWGGKGAPGPTGQTGPSGAFGIKSAACLKLGPNSVGDCSKF